MFLNVGGAVLGVAVLTVISDSVASNNGGRSNLQANLEGYRAGYYAAIAMIAIGLILSVVFAHKKGQQQEQQPQRQGRKQEGDEQESEDDKKKAEKEETLVAGTETASATVGEETESKTKGRNMAAGSSEEENDAVRSSSVSGKMFN